MPLSFRHLTSTKQLSRADADLLLKKAHEMDAVLEKKGQDERRKGKVLAALFYEPSTRTRLSFETAMLRLGGQVITADGFQFSHGRQHAGAANLDGNGVDDGFGAFRLILKGAGPARTAGC